MTGSVALPRQASLVSIASTGEDRALFVAEDSLSPNGRKKYVKSRVCDGMKCPVHGTIRSEPGEPCSPCAGRVPSPSGTNRPIPGTNSMCGVDHRQDWRLDGLIAERDAVRCRGGPRGQLMETAATSILAGRQTPITRRRIAPILTVPYLMAVTPCGRSCRSGAFSLRVRSSLSGVILLIRSAALQSRCFGRWLFSAVGSRFVRGARRLRAAPLPPWRRLLRWEHSRGRRTTLQRYSCRAAKNCPTFPTSGCPMQSNIPCFTSVALQPPSAPSHTGNGRSKEPPIHAEGGSSRTPAGITQINPHFLFNSEFDCRLEPLRRVKVTGFDGRAIASATPNIRCQTTRATHSGGGARVRSDILEDTGHSACAVAIGNRCRSKLQRCAHSDPDSHVPGRERRISRLARIAGRHARRNSGQMR